MGELKVLADLLNYSNITVAIITFQPNEDRLVKAFIKENQLAVVQKSHLWRLTMNVKKPREKSAKHGFFIYSVLLFEFLFPRHKVNIRIIFSIICIY